MAKLMLLNKYNHKEIIILLLIISAPEKDQNKKSNSKGK